jgi:hypothetical protein
MSQNCLYDKQAIVQWGMEGCRTNCQDYGKALKFRGQDGILSAD